MVSHLLEKGALLDNHWCMVEGQLGGETVCQEFADRESAHRLLFCRHDAKTAVLYRELLLDRS
jgi:hypothetical protein